jgi:hypothetical protein
MSLYRTIRVAFVCAMLSLGFGGVALGQCLECGSIFAIDPAIALNGFALLSGVIALLFSTCRSRP